MSIDFSLAGGKSLRHPDGGDRRSPAGARIGYNGPAMDTITQGLLGAVTAQLGFRQRLGPRATWAAAAAAVAPDLDVFIVPLMELTGAETEFMAVSRYHRGITHSLFMVPVIAAAAAGVWWFLGRRARRRAQTQAPAEPPAPDGDAPQRGPPGFGWLLACCFVAVLSHPLLDWCTSYGTQLLGPLTDTRYAIDAAPIIDLIYTPILILTLAACWAVRKIKADPRRAALAVGWAGFALSVAYLAAGRVLHDRAVARARELASDATIVRADAYPAIGAIFLWRTVVETDRDWRVTRLRPLSALPADQLRCDAAPKIDDPWTRRAARLPAAKTFRWFAMGRVRAEHEVVDARHVVTFHDMRYGSPLESADSMWSLRVVFDAAGKAVHVASQRRHRRRGSFAQVLRRAWNDLWAP